MQKLPDKSIQYGKMPVRMWLMIPHSAVQSRSETGFCNRRIQVKQASLLVTVNSIISYFSIPLFLP